MGFRLAFDSFFIDSRCRQGIETDTLDDVERQYVHPQLQSSLNDENVNRDVNRGMGC